MNHNRENFERALSNGSLVELAMAMKEHGEAQQQVYDEFNWFRDLLRQQNREGEEDIVTDVMDRIIGWCSPSARLF